MIVHLVLDGEDIKLEEVYSINESYGRIYLHYYVRERNDRVLRTMNIEVSRIVDMIVDL